MVDHVQKIRVRKQKTDIGIYSSVNKTIKNWNQLPAEALGLSVVHLRNYKGSEMKGIEVWRISFIISVN